MGQFEMMASNIYAAAKIPYTLMENLLLWTMTQTEQIQFNPEKVLLTTVIREVIKA